MMENLDVYLVQVEGDNGWIVGLYRDKDAALAEAIAESRAYGPVLVELHAVDRDAEPIEIAHYQFGEDFATFWQKKASPAT